MEPEKSIKLEISDSFLKKWDLQAVKHLTMGTLTINHGENSIAKSILPLSKSKTPSLAIIIGSSPYNSTDHAITPANSCNSLVLPLSSSLVIFLNSPSTPSLSADECYRDVRVSLTVSSLSPGQRQLPGSGGGRLYGGEGKAPTDGGGRQFVTGFIGALFSQ